MEKREMLMPGREHLTLSGKFQSDKYSWCPAGYLPIKISDPDALDLMYAYASRREGVDREFARDLRQALRIAEQQRSEQQRREILGEAPGHE